MKKLKDKIEETRQRHGSSPSVPAKMGQSSSKLHWLLVIGCLALSGGASYFVLTTYVLAKIPDTIAGTWRVESGDMKGDKMTFHRDGTFTAMVTGDGGSVAPVTARVELHDKTLRYIFEMPGVGRQERVQTIKSLTRTEMVVQEGDAMCKLVRLE